ncbi:prolipoprotein diacylglyceryl transferase [Thermomonospora curvata]|uniref:Phosphatidylglycerol--prolipoprotein diacylglyceryl transferase n=1 Tax=Thermomonospora curvata (strain ATCC 19995 / DSM 43183 / JCM 3096 / KCTC 9072 / NBRC 15933 / NCIMB 10081 / Henssen B9) TaxID=471852 RepID=D1A711_THECD|nr:prolipoprotein diacylglyceryl transferase [Thermomonospora curvata]ACY98415.1 prolipoprotein diacylglyceryl transferase [Thermomonospora curvata DSM 43183]
MQPLATIPSPAEGVWHLGPIPIRAYALMIIAGIVVAVWLGERRWAAKGGTPGVVIDVAVWAVPFGLLGGRLYHVITDWQRYFGDGGDPGRAVRVWEGGLGIWGAIALGALGAWIGCRRRGVSVLALGDAIAPGLALAQAIGRWGNWWNQELYGRPLNTWWALEIDPEHRPRIPGTSAIDPRYADVATYHPTFLYESLWCAGLALVVIWAGRRFTLTHGRTFALYVAGYTVGRFWIEWLRIDEAHVIAGLRLNDWTCLVVFAGAVAYLWLARNRTSPEAVTVKDPAAPHAETGRDRPAAPGESAAGSASEPAERSEPETTPGPGGESAAAGPASPSPAGERPEPASEPTGSAPASGERAEPASEAGDGATAAGAGSVPEAEDEPAVTGSGPGLASGTEKEPSAAGTQAATETGERPEPASAPPGEPDEAEDTAGERAASEPAGQNESSTGDGPAPGTAAAGGPPEETSDARAADGGGTPGEGKGAQRAGRTAEPAEDAR